MTEPTPAAPLWTRDFLLLLAGTFLQGVAFFLLLPVLPLLLVGPMGAGEEVVGFVVGVFALTAVLIRPFGGYLLDRFGRRAFQLGAAGAIAISMLGYLAADSVSGLVGWRLLHGLAWGVVGIASATVVADLIPPGRRGVGMGVYGMAMPLALSVGPLLGALLLDGEHFSRVFVVGAAMSLAALACFQRVDTPRVRGEPVPIRLGRLFEPRVGRLFVFMLPLCVGYGGWTAFSPLFAPEVGLKTAGPLFAAYAVGGLSSRLLAGRWYDAHGARWPGLAALVVVTFGWGLLGSASTQVEALAAAAATGLGFGILMPVFQSMTIDLVPAGRRGAAAATTFSAYDIGIAMGAFTFGFLVEGGGFGLIFHVAGLLTLVALAWFLLVVMPHFERNRLRVGTTTTATGR